MEGTSGGSPLPGTPCGICGCPQREQSPASLWFHMRCNHVIQAVPSTTDHPVPLPPSPMGARETQVWEEGKQG